MIKLFKKIFQRKPKPFLANDFRIIPAFELRGEVYYMHEDPMSTATGRGLSAMQCYEEILMRCDVEFLQSFIKAAKGTINNPKKIDLVSLMKLLSILEERTSLLVALPDQVYKMATITFFTKEESPFKWSEVAARKKIKQWKEAEGMYDFFLQSPLKDLLPFLQLPEAASKDYLKVAEKIDRMHCRNLQEVLSRIMQQAESTS